jgi:predicted permease
MSLLNDLRYAARVVRSSPTFTAVAVMTLALGIGISTAGFSLANWLLLRPVPGVTDPDQLVIVWSAARSRNGLRPTFVSYAQYAGFRDRLTALSGLAGYQRSSVNVGAEGAEPRRLNVHYVMPSYFQVLGVRPELGRPFGPEDDASPAGRDVAVISDRVWASMFGRDLTVLGRSVRVDGRRFTAVGVAPPGFEGTELFGETDLWLPGRTGESAREGGYYEFVGRLVPGATFLQAEAQLRAVMRSEQEPAPMAPGWEPGPVVFRGVGVMPLRRSSVAGAVQLVMVVCLVVLLLACANAANLLLFRGLMRRSHVALHRVLGAATFDVGRRSMVESLMLGVMGILVGLLLSTGFVRVFRSADLTGSSSTLGPIPIDWRVLVFACGAGIISALVAGAASTYVAARTDALEAIKRTASTVAVGGGRARRVLGATQLALSLTLLVGAFLMLRTLRNLNAVDLGLDPRGVVIMQIAPDQAASSDVQVRGYYRELRWRVQAAPGIESAAVAWQAPFVGVTRVATVVAPTAAQGTTDIRARYNAVSPGYFRTLEMPLLAGRTFSEAEFLPDSADQRKVVLSASLARRLFADRAAVGEYVYSHEGDLPLEVVGVVADTKWASIEEGDAHGPMSPQRGAMLFVPFGQERLDRGVLLVRSNLAEATVTATVRRIAADIDPSLPLYGVSTLRSLIDQKLSDRILFLKVLSCLAALGVLLAGLGLYGLIGFGVTARTRELGIRIALGAARRNVMETVLREAFWVVTLGLPAGLAGAWVIGRLVQNKLYAVPPTDPVSYALSGAVLVMACLLAALLPVRVATRVDPTVALRAE